MKCLFFWSTRSYLLGGSSYVYFNLLVCKMLLRFVVNGLVCLCLIEWHFWKHIFCIWIKILSLTDGYWLDGTYNLREGLWFWNSTGTYIAYHNWGENEPNNPGTEHCLEIKTSKNYTWNDEYCNNAKRYICETTI